MKVFTCILALSLIVSLGGCSRSGDAPAPVTTAAAQPAGLPPAAPPPVSAPEALTPEVAARLVRAHSPVLGAAKAPVTVVEVLDPACEACRAFAPVVKQLLFLYPADVRVVVRFADFHPGSEQAIRLLEAARKQGKFEELLNALFERQEEWASHAAPDPGRIWRIATDTGVDVAKARKDAHAASVDELLRVEAEDLVAIRVERTPTFYVNGKPLATFGVEQLMDLVASEVHSAR